MKKKFVALTIVLMLSFTACDNGGTDASNSANAIVEEDAGTAEDTAVSAEAEGAGEADEADEVEEAAEPESYKYEEYASMSAEEIVASLTLEQKAAQMVMPAVYNTDEDEMKEFDYGAILSKSESVNYDDWQEIVDGFQKAAISSEAGIPFIYGQDDVHGVNYCSNAVMFPQNIGAGAANDPELMYQVGLITADEAKLCHMLWNYAPVLAQSEDPRWGRTYESYGADLEIIKSLGTAYTKGLIDGGIIACPKHFFAEGNVEYGTGENSDCERLIDRGDSVLTDDEIAAQLDLYQAQIDAGAQSIMVSHSSLNGVKMHENEKYIKMLKEDMGFEGFISGDWNSVHNTSAGTYREQVINSVNAGVDLLMEVDDYNEVIGYIVDGVNNGDIAVTRVDDAVTRIIRVKLNAGIFDDPMQENVETVQSATGSEEYREVAKKLVEESLVLLKNEGNVLPFKEGQTIYVTGPAADNGNSQCGGWSLDWTGTPTNYVPGLTTILQGFKDEAEKYGITVVTDSKDAEAADATVIVVGEYPYAEWTGDTEDMALCGMLGLDGNMDAIEEAKELGKPTVACIVAGRQVILDEYMDDWDAAVMCYLPGTEGDGVAEVLYGGAEFTGKLPSPWYGDISEIGTDKCWLEKGYGLSY